ncbi:hypothetical protein ACVWVY_006039 [Bradyrhizobium sp. URHC0002]
MTPQSADVYIIAFVSIIACLIAFVVFFWSFTPHQNRKALDRSKASDRSPCREALAHNLDRSAGARNLDLVFRTRDTHYAGVLCPPER